MLPKNRKFNIAGTSFYEGRVRLGSKVYLARELNNEKDTNAVQVISQKGELVGYIPRTLATEVASFVTGKYTHYCAKVVELWTIPNGEREGEVVPQVLAHFANKPEELPYAPQEWLNPLPTTYDMRDY